MKKVFLILISFILMTLPVFSQSWECQDAVDNFRNKVMEFNYAADSLEDYANSLKNCASYNNPIDDCYSEFNNTKDAYEEYETARDDLESAKSEVDSYCDY